MSANRLKLNTDKTGLPWAGLRQEDFLVASSRPLDQLQAYRPNSETNYNIAILIRGFMWCSSYIVCKFGKLQLNNHITAEPHSHDFRGAKMFFWGFDPQNGE